MNKKVEPKISQQAGSKSTNGVFHHLQVLGLSFVPEQQSFLIAKTSKQEN
jgi:hypothetical protein